MSPDPGAAHAPTCTLIWRLLAQFYSVIHAVKDEMTETEALTGKITQRKQASTIALVLAESFDSLIYMEVQGGLRTRAH